MIDLSGNGTLADEAALLTGIAAVLGAMTGIFVAAIRRDARKTSNKLDEVVITLNHVDEEVTPESRPTLGQRVVRIERQVDSIQSTLNELNTTMSEHIQWEQKKSDRIDGRLNKVEATLKDVRDQMAGHHPEEPAEDEVASAIVAPVKRARRKSR